MQPLGEQLISSTNLYIDTIDAQEDTSSTGTSYVCHLGADAPSCSDGQILRMSLIDFSMYNGLYTVNSSNNSYRVVYNQGYNDASLGAVGQSFSNLFDMMIAFGNSFGAQISAILPIQPPTKVEATNLAFDETTSLLTGTRKFGVKLTFPANHGLPPGDVSSSGNY